MIVRLLLVTLSLFGVALLGAQVDPAFGAPTAVGPISFSESVDQLARPVNPSVLFPPGTNRIWASFDYFNHQQGTKITFLLRMNDQDFKFAELTCCAGVAGRYAFPIDPLLPGEAGAGYEVVIFDNGAEASRGFFAVAAVPNENDVGGDNGGDGDENANDNDDQQGNENGDGGGNDNG